MGIYLTCHVCTLMIWVKSGTKVILSFKVTVKFEIFFFFLETENSKCVVFSILVLIFF